MLNHTIFKGSRVTVTPHEPEFQITVLTPEYQAQLWDWLHIALWDPPPAPLRPREILDNPHVRIYAEDWGRPGDIGAVGLVDGQPIGACWMRLLLSGVGMSYLDDETPQLGIALLVEHKRKGYGTQLMLAALNAAREQGVAQVSLTTHPENPAVRMYEKCGFEKIEIRNTYYLMVAKL
ncbi:MAG: GNAT family N-acetyltransferase [Chthonomonadales bacterium]